jgi:PAS domain S-box-containing protein
MQATKEVKQGLSDPADALERIEEVLRLGRTMIWEVDRQGVYTYASASHETLLGYRPEELVGIHTIHDFYPREVPAELQRELSEDWIGAGEEFTELELPLVTKAGEVVWVTSHGKPIFGADGELIGFRGADTDITARKRAEAEVQRTTERMQVAARAGGIGFWEHDYRNGREEWDEGMLRIYGMTRA